MLFCMTCIHKVKSEIESMKMYSLAFDKDIKLYGIIMLKKLKEKENMLLLV